MVHNVGGRDSILQLVRCTASCWESLDVLYIYGNKPMINIVHYVQSLAPSSFLQGLLRCFSMSVTLDMLWCLPVTYISGCPSLDHLYLFGAVLCMWVPHWRGILHQRSYQALLISGFSVSWTSPVGCASGTPVINGRIYLWLIFWISKIVECMG